MLLSISLNLVHGFFFYQGSLTSFSSCLGGGNAILILIILLKLGFPFSLGCFFLELISLSLSLSLSLSPSLSARARACFPIKVDTNQLMKMVSFYEKSACHNSSRPFGVQGNLH